MGNKKGDFGFVWIFAILAGIAILLLMIYTATRLIDTSRTLGDTKLAKALTSELDLLEAGGASTISATLETTFPTKISISCLEEGYGDNRIQISTNVKGGEDGWSTGEEIVMKDKYVFSNSEIEGEGFNVFSEAFEYPYKIADLIFLSSEEYCFLEAPTKLKSRYGGITGISFDDCQDNDVTVCFGKGSCNISVEGMCENVICETEFDYGFVRRDGEAKAYSDSLLLAAIISDDENYECNVERLLYRGSRIASILQRKAELATARGCNTGLETYLSLLEATFVGYSSYDFISDTETMITIKELNEAESCGLW